MEGVDGYGISEGVDGKPDARRVAHHQALRIDAAIARLADQHIRNVAAGDLDIGEASEDAHRPAGAAGDIENLAAAIRHEQLYLAPRIAFSPMLEDLRPFLIPVDGEILLARARRRSMSFRALLLLNRPASECRRSLPKNWRTELANRVLHRHRGCFLLSLALRPG